MFVSFCNINCVSLAIVEEYSLGKAKASSNELVCKDCVPPNIDAIASIVVLEILFIGEFADRLQPDV